MIKIYHNPRCSKSRQGLAIVEESGKEFETIKYLEEDLTSVELQDIIIKLGIKIINTLVKIFFAFPNKLCFVFIFIIYIKKKRR